jgi:hypothetical protein
VTGSSVIAAAGMALLALVIAAGLRRAWASEGPALARARAWLATIAIGIWAGTLVVLGDRFAVRFSAIDLAAMLWAAVGVALAACLALVVEPIARRVAARWPGTGAGTGTGTEERGPLTGLRS